MDMAKRKYSKMKKIEPSVQTLTFLLGSAGPAVPANTTSNYYLDISQVASLVNRRFYRQGINWAVAGIKFLTSDRMEGSIVVSKLPNTWIMSNAWEKGFRAWQKMNNEALAETPSIKPRFLDFKIYADGLHHDVGFGANLLPTSYSGSYTAGEWDSSKVVIPFGPASPGNSAENEFIAVGASFPGAGASGLNAVSLIEGYAASRGLPNQLDPNTPGDADDADGSTPENWLSAMFNEGVDQTSEVLENMINEGHRAPYPFEGDNVSLDTMYPGGANQGTGMQIHDAEFISPTTVGGVSRIKGGNFPCGLMNIQIENATDFAQDVTILLDLVPGSHRGYLCEPMTEM